MEVSPLSLGLSKSILIIEITFGSLKTSDKTARNYPEIAKPGTPVQPDLSSQKGAPESGDQTHQTHQIHKTHQMVTSAQADS